MKQSEELPNWDATIIELAEANFKQFKTISDHRREMNERDVLLYNHGHSYPKQGAEEYKNTIPGMLEFTEKLFAA